MGYQSRKRNYQSRREKLKQHFRNYRMAFIFLMIALIVILYKNRWDIWNWIQTYFY
jgi:hypothetical protein